MISIAHHRHGVTVFYDSETDELFIRHQFVPEKLSDGRLGFHEVRQLFTGWSRRPWSPEPKWPTRLVRRIVITDWVEDARHDVVRIG